MVKRRKEGGEKGGRERGRKGGSEAGRVGGSSLGKGPYVCIQATCMRE